MDRQIIYDKLKKAKALKFITNCYSADMIEKSCKMWIEGDEFIFLYDDHGIQRVAYCARDWNSVDRLLSSIDEEPCYIEFLTRDPEEYYPRNSECLAAMMRMSNSDCRSVFDDNSLVVKYKNDIIPEEATESDAEEITEILWSVFRTEISHLLSVTEIRQRILEGQISIHRDGEGHIDAILQANEMPRKFYINQIVNKADKSIIHAVLLQRLERYVANGGKYLYAWVEKSNVASVRFHEKYGMKHDGMWSMVFCLYASKEMNSINFD